MEPERPLDKASPRGKRGGKSKAKGVENENASTSTSAVQGGPEMLTATARDWEEPQEDKRKSRNTLKREECLIFPIAEDARENDFLQRMFATSSRYKILEEHSKRIRFPKLYNVPAYIEEDITRHTAKHRIGLSVGYVSLLESSLEDTPEFDEREHCPPCIVSDIKFHLTERQEIQNWIKLRTSLLSTETEYPAEDKQEFYNEIKAAVNLERYVIYTGHSSANKNFSFRIENKMNSTIGDLATKEMGMQVSALYQLLTIDSLRKEQNIFHREDMDEAIRHFVHRVELKTRIVAYTARGMKLGLTPEIDDFLAQEYGI